MALDVFFVDQIERALVGGLVLAIRSNGGRDLEYLRGNFALAEHQAAVFGCNWLDVIRQARGRLDTDGLTLLDKLGPRYGGGLGEGRTLARMGGGA